MFVTIKMDGKCPDCDGKVEEWQTKDLVIDGIYPVVNFGQMYKVNNRMSAEIHAYCDKCKKDVNLKIKKGKVKKEKLVLGSYALGNYKFRRADAYE